ncbi:unnamed protein product, partial [Staurois parvus]
MSEQYRYPPNVRTVQISPKCQDSTDIPQMSGQYRYPPNVRTVQISPRMSGQYRYPPNVRTVQISPKCQNMTPFCRVDSPTYFIRGMASFFKLYFFCH